VTGRLAVDSPPFNAEFETDASLEAPAAKQEYDKFKDLTVVSIPPLSSGLRYYYIRPQLKAFAAYPGQKLLASPKSARIGFFAHSDGWQYLRCHEVDILADGKRIVIKETTHDGTVGKGYVLEHIDSTIIWPEIVKINSAKVVEAKICNTKITFSAQNMTDLKEFVRLLTPKGARQPN